MKITQFCFHQKHSHLNALSIDICSPHVLEDGIHGAAVIKLLLKLMGVSWSKVEQNISKASAIRERIRAYVYVQTDGYQSYLTLCDPTHCSPPGSSVHRISQARKMEWVDISLSKGSSWPRVWTCVSCTGRWILYLWATVEALCLCVAIFRKFWMC